MGMKAEEAYGAAIAYVQKSLIGLGALKGKNCVISNIEDIEGGHKVHFQWTSDSGVVDTSYIVVMDGVSISEIRKEDNTHIIVEYDDGTESDPIEIPGIPPVITVYEDTDDSYKLKIVCGEDEIITPNFRAEAASFTADQVKNIKNLLK